MRGKASRSGPGGEIGEAPPVADAARRFRGSAPIGGHDSGRQSVGTTVGKRTPPLRTAWWLVRRADVGIGPYGRFDKKVPYVESPSHGFAVPASFRQGDRGDGLPQPVTSVTGFAMTYYKECIGRADVGVGPYGSVTRGAMGGRPQGSPLRRVTSSTGGGPMWASAPTGGLARKCLRRIPQSRLCRASPL